MRSTPGQMPTQQQPSAYVCTAGATAFTHSPRRLKPVMGASRPVYAGFEVSNQLSVLFDRWDYQHVILQLTLNGEVKQRKLTAQEATDLARALVDVASCIQNEQAAREDLA